MEYDDFSQLVDLLWDDRITLFEGFGYMDL